MHCGYLAIGAVFGLIIGGCAAKEVAPEVASTVHDKSIRDVKPAAKDTKSSRIGIKRGTDPDAKLISKSVKDITVEDLLAMKLPKDFKGKLEDYADKRVGDFEKSTYRLKGTLTSVQHKKDGDYFLTVKGKSGASAVVEIPDPKLTKGSAVQPGIESARDGIEKKYHPTDTKKEVNDEVTLEGVGFYGWKGNPGAGGKNSAPRLMPGTGFKSGS